VNHQYETIKGKFLTLSDENCLGLNDDSVFPQRKVPTQKPKAAGSFGVTEFSQSPNQTFSGINPGTDCANGSSSSCGYSAPYTIRDIARVAGVSTATVIAGTCRLSESRGTHSKPGQDSHIG